MRFNLAYITGVDDGKVIHKTRSEIVPGSFLRLIYQQQQRGTSGESPIADYTLYTLIELTKLGLYGMTSYGIFSGISAILK